MEPGRAKVQYDLFTVNSPWAAAITATAKWHALHALPAPPDGLHHLFTSDSTDAKQFRKRIRQYNSALAFASFTANEKNVNRGGGGIMLENRGRAK